MTKHKAINHIVKTLNIIGYGVTKEMDSS